MNILRYHQCRINEQILFVPTWLTQNISFTLLVRYKKGTKRLKLAICIFWVFWHYISSMRQIGSFCPTIVVFLTTLLKTDCLYVHYHLQVQANQKKKLYKKTNAIFSIYGKNWIIPWHFFFEFSLRPFEVV